MGEARLKREVQYAEHVHLLIDFLNKTEIPFEQINIRDDATGIELAGIRFAEFRWAKGKDGKYIPSPIE